MVFHPSSLFSATFTQFHSSSMFSSVKWAYSDDSHNSKICSVSIVNLILRRDGVSLILRGTVLCIQDFSFSVFSWIFRICFPISTSARILLCVNFGFLFTLNSIPNVFTLNDERYCLIESKPNQSAQSQQWTRSRHSQSKQLAENCKQPDQSRQQHWA